MVRVENEKKPDTPYKTYLELLKGEYRIGLDMAARETTAVQSAVFLAVNFPEFDKFSSPKWIARELLMRAPDSMMTAQLKEELECVVLSQSESEPQSPGIIKSMAQPSHVAQLMRYRPDVNEALLRGAVLLGDVRLAAEELAANAPRFSGQEMREILDATINNGLKLEYQKIKDLEELKKQI